MRWEEMWNASLRLRNKFLKSKIQDDLKSEMESLIINQFKESSLAERSSSSCEDSEGVSFAGLHYSFLNISCIDEVFNCIKLVWASLWSLNT